MKIPPLLLVLLPLALASSGDRHGTYLACKSECVSQCDPASISPFLKALAWDCPSDCGYHCSHQLTDASDEGREYYHQFHGKWAFHRIWGMQEPASVIFSLGNLVVHWQGYNMVKRRLNKDNGLGFWLKIAALVQVNTWFWSAVFHTRDLPWTERLDYFSATVTIGNSLHYAIIRIFGLQGARTHTKLLYPVTALVLLVVVGHFSYVSSLPFFPYGYHVAFAGALGMIGNTLWTMWSVSFKYRPSIAGFTWPAPYPPTAPSPSPSLTTAKRGAQQANWTPAILVLLTTLAMSLELLDFPPHARVLDAHSLWHAATIPLAVWWWDFLVKDAREVEVRAAQRLE